MRIVGFGTYDLSRHPRIGIVLDGLRERGEDVVEVNAPLGFSTAERVAMLAQPWLAYRLVIRVLARWLALIRMARAVKRAGPIDAVAVGYLGQLDVLLARALFRRERIVLDLMTFGADTARDRGVSGGLRLRLLDALDHLAVRCSDIVMLDTAEHIDLLRLADRPKAVVVDVGAPREWLGAGAAPGVPGEATLSVVFFGLFTPLQGTPVIGAALAALAADDISVTMIGTGQDLAQTRSLAADNLHVRWIDWVDAEQLPALVASHDVCLGIFGTSPKAHRVVPNKVYQGAAAGCAIVTSDTAPQRRALGDAACYVPPGDASALAAALRDLAADPEATARLRNAARIAATTRFAPDRIVAPLHTRLQHRRDPGAGPAQMIARLDA